MFRYLLQLLPGGLKEKRNKVVPSGSAGYKRYWSYETALCSARSNNLLSWELWLENWLSSLSANQKEYLFNKSPLPGSASLYLINKIYMRQYWIVKFELKFSFSRRPIKPQRIQNEKEQFPWSQFEFRWRSTFQCQGIKCSNIFTFNTITPSRFFEISCETRISSRLKRCLEHNSVNLHILLALAEQNQAL